MTIDKKLSFLRKKERLTQAEVSEKLDVSRQAVSRWEAGTSNPSIENLQALCKLYHVPLDYLLNESEDEPPAPIPAATATESEFEEKKGKRGQWIKWLEIDIVVLVLIVCCLVLFSRQKKNEIDLHMIQHEDTSSLEVPEFNLNWGVTGRG